jgi:tetratricopeptide (TPR) repeat protein
MRKTGLRFIVFLTAALLLPTELFAQKKESLAVFAFTGGNASDGEAVASSLSRQATLRNAFNKTTLITRTTIAAMNFEHRFQRSGLTDADTIFELGKALNASHVIAGYITRLGTNNLVLVGIMDVESLQQIAGYYKQYSNIEEVDRLIPEMANQLIRSITRDTRNLPGLSVPPFVFSRGVDQNDAMTLAQILSCDLANLGKYAVLPRTDSIEKILEEQRRQRSGITDQERIKRLGVGRNAKYVLSGSVERLGTLNKFAADILDILDGSYIDGYAEEYRTLAEGFTVIPKLAAQLSSQGSSASAPAVREYIARGDSYMKEKDYALAIAEYTQAIRLDTNNVEAYVERGRAYSLLGNDDRAIADFTQAIRLNPNYSEAYRLRGLIYGAYYKEQYADFDRAIADYTQLIRLNPNDRVAYMSRAEIYKLKKDYNRAIADYTQMIKLDPNVSITYTFRGCAYKELGDFNRAISDFETALRMWPEDYLAKSNLDDIRAQQRRTGR